MAAISSSFMTPKAFWCASSCRGRATSRPARLPLSLVEQPAQNRRVHDDRFSQFGNKRRIALRLDVVERELRPELTAPVLMHAVDQQPPAVFVTFDQM